MSWVWTALALFAAFFVLAALDGIYYHFKRFRLWAYQDTLTEHALHTTRAVLMPATLVALFTPGTTALIVAIVLIALDLIAAAADVAVEWRSRKRFGGLPHGEYIVHLAATTVHVAAETLIVAKRVSGADVELDVAAQALVVAMVVGSALGAVHHVALLVRGAWRPEPMAPA